MQEQERISKDLQELKQLLQEKTQQLQELQLAFQTLVMELSESKKALAKGKI